MSDEQVVFRSPALDEAVKAYSGFAADSRMRGKNSLDQMGGMLFGTALSHQFKVVDFSEYSEDGGLLSLRLSVIDGNAPESGIAGTLNGVEYPAATLFSSPLPLCYVYAIDGQIYILNHRFASDLLPVLLVAVVTVKDNSVTIEQRNFTNDPAVPVKAKENGAVTFDYSLSYDENKLTAEYTVAVRMAVNNIPVEFSAEKIPQTDSPDATGRLVAYVQSMTVEYNSEPVKGFVFGNAPEGAEWYTSVLSYKFYDNNFRILSVVENPWAFAFAQLPLNAAEAGA